MQRDKQFKSVGNRVTTCLTHVKFILFSTRLSMELMPKEAHVFPDRLKISLHVILWKLTVYSSFKAHYLKGVIYILIGLRTL
jgi:hypothetical protein